MIVVSERGHFDVVRLLLERGAQVGLYLTLLHAIIHKQHHVVAMFDERVSPDSYDSITPQRVSLDAQVDLVDSGGRSALMLAAKHGYHSMAMVLLERGAQVDLKDNLGKSVLMFASEKGSTKLAQLLLKMGAQVDLQDNGGMSALMLTSTMGYFDFSQLLLENGAQIDLRDGKGRSALMIASGYRCTEVVELLLGKGAQVNLQDDDGMTALVAGLFNPYQFKESGLPEEEIFPQIVADGVPKVVKLLLENGAHTDLTFYHSRSALRFASAIGFYEAVELLLEKGAQIDLLDEEGMSALMHTIESEFMTESTCIKIVKQLLERGAQVNLQRADGRSALMLAVLRSTGLSLEKSAQVNPQDNDLMLASNHLSYSLVQTLLDYGAQTDLEDNKGNTAASLTSNKRIIRLLNGLTKVSIMHY